MAKRRGEQPHSLNQHFHHVKQVKTELTAKVKVLEAENQEKTEKIEMLETDLQTEHQTRMECQREKNTMEVELHKLESNADRQLSRVRTSELEKKIEKQNMVIETLMRADGGDETIYKSKYEKLEKILVAFDKKVDQIIFDWNHEIDMNAAKSKKIRELEFEIEELGYVKDQYEILKEKEAENRDTRIVRRKCR